MIIILSFCIDSTGITTIPVVTLGLVCIFVVGLMLILERDLDSIETSLWIPSGDSLRLLEDILVPTWGYSDLSYLYFWFEDINELLYLVYMENYPAFLLWLGLLVSVGYVSCFSCYFGISKFLVTFSFLQVISLSFSYFVGMYLFWDSSILLESS